MKSKTEQLRMKRFSILLFLVSVAHAEVPNECQLVEETSTMLMQLRQNGLSLDDVDFNPEALSAKEQALLKGMIDDAKDVPIYQIPLTRQKAIDDFKLKWQEVCQSADVVMPTETR
ncbi:hypothetical protein [Acinetobacter sp.]|jgi:hypothetical protein|uniref:hypothetical protein n=1 Tax=Acinetobacter sp. TaxID=472 RepID=UPI002852AB45|nr:hypothetical protein [Acinetobacter sp.]